MQVMAFVVLLIVCAIVGLLLGAIGLAGIILCRKHRKKNGRKAKPILRILSYAALVLGIIITLIPVYFVSIYGYNQHQQGQYEKSIEAAADANNYARVQQLLAEGINPDECFGDGTYTPLMHACTGLDGYQMAELLIQNHADVNASFSGYDNGADRGYTPLFYAVSDPGKYDLVQLLLDNGADANHQSEDGTTALKLAKKNNNSAVVQLLIENGARE